MRTRGLKISVVRAKVRSEAIYCFKRSHLFKYMNKLGNLRSYKKSKK